MIASSVLLVFMSYKDCYNPPVSIGNILYFTLFNFSFYIFPIFQDYIFIKKKLKCVFNNYANLFGLNEHKWVSTK